MKIHIVALESNRADSGMHHMIDALTVTQAEIDDTVAEAVERGFAEIYFHCNESIIDIVRDLAE